MRIGMVAYTFYEEDNRVRRYAETLAQRGDRVDVIALRRQGRLQRDVMNGVNVYRLQRRTVNEKGKFTYLVKLFLFFVRSMFFLTREHLRNRYDVIHVHSVPDFEVFAALIPKLLGAKIILDIHDIGGLSDHDEIQGTEREAAVKSPPKNGVRVTSSVSNQYDIFSN